jgi:hypothetical protein
MASLETTRAALRNAVRACVVTSANQSALLTDYPHGGTELGEIASVQIGIQDKLFVPKGWEFHGQPVDHGWREGQVWVLALRLRAMQDTDWRGIAFRTVATTDGYAPADGTIKSDQGGFVAAGGMLLLSPVDLTHDAIVCYAPIRGIGPEPIHWGSDRPAVGSLMFTLGRHATIGEPVAVDRLEHLRLS